MADLTNHLQSKLSGVQMKQFQVQDIVVFSGTSSKESFATYRISSIVYVRAEKAIKYAEQSYFRTRIGNLVPQKTLTECYIAMKHRSTGTFFEEPMITTPHA